MTDYIVPALETDGDALAQVAYDYLQSVFPGWQPADGNLETILIESLSPLAAESRDVASDVTNAIFKYWGQKVIGLEPVFATPATATSTWTVTDTLGHTIPADTLVGLINADGDVIGFAVQEDVVIAPGSSSTAVGEVALVAVEDGADNNGLSGAVTLLDSIDWIASVMLTAATSGGLDEEDDDTYMGRLTDRLRLFTPTPITPADFELASRTFPGVQRALALDMYDPVAATYGHERTVTVAVVDIVGQPVGAPVKAALDAYLQGMREVNFVVNIIDGTYTTIDVTFTATCYKQYDPGDVQTRAVAAVTSYLSPGSWGLPDFGSEPLWLDQTDVRFWEIIGVLNNVEGLDTIDSCTIGIGGGAQAQADLALVEPAPLPEPGAIIGTVTAP